MFIRFVDILSKRGRFLLAPPPKIMTNMVQLSTRFATKSRCRTPAELKRGIYQETQRKKWMNGIVLVIKDAGCINDGKRDQRIFSTGCSRKLLAVDQFAPAHDFVGDILQKSRRG